MTVVIGPGSEKKWYSIKEDSPQGIWDNIAEKMLVEFAESGCPIFRATTPLSRGQLRSKGHGKLSIHFAADVDTIDTIYRIIHSVNQFSVYGAVAAVCEEFESHQDRSGEPEILMGQSIVLGEIKAETPLHDEDPMNDQTIWQQYIQQVDDENHEPMMWNEGDMDFRIPGLPHSVVKHAQSTSVRQLIQKIENHPIRHALQQDLRQNQSFNPFSPKSKQMIRDVGNIELCELLETEPKTQCTVCLSYWNIGIVYCTCGHFLRKGRGTNQQFIKCTMDLLSIPEYVFKKGRPHGHRYGKKPGDREYFSANQLKKK